MSGIAGSTDEPFRNAGSYLIKAGAEFYSRGWLYGTSGNLSAVIQEDPLQLAITASGLDKGSLDQSSILRIDGNRKVLDGNHNPSAETALHLAVVRVTGAGAVFHTHSKWSTILSELYAGKGMIELKGYEMLKGLDGINTHDHVETVPVIENSQDMDELSRHVEDILLKNSEIHAFILRGHGLYTWGKTMEDARRHVEVIEFLLEVHGRMRLA